MSLKNEPECAFGSLPLNSDDHSFSLSRLGLSKLTESCTLQTSDSKLQERSHLDKQFGRLCSMGTTSSYFFQTIQHSKIRKRIAFAFRLILADVWPRTSRRKHIEPKPEMRSLFVLNVVSKGLLPFALSSPCFLRQYPLAHPELQNGTIRASLITALHGVLKPRGFPVNIVQC